MHNHPLLTFSSPVGILTAANPRHPGPLAGNQEGLKAEILKLGGRIEETNGKYGDPEPSLVVHNLPEHHLVALGKAAGQESVIHSANGQRKMIHTNGDHAGEYNPGKPGYEVWAEDAKDLPQDYYTHFPGRGYVRLHFDHSKFLPYENSGIAKSSHNLLIQELKRVAPMADKDKSDLRKSLHRLHQGLEKTVKDFEVKCVAMRKAEAGVAGAIHGASGMSLKAEKPTLCKLCDSDMKKCHCDKMEKFAKDLNKALPIQSAMASTAEAAAKTAAKRPEVKGSGGKPDKHQIANAKATADGKKGVVAKPGDGVAKAIKKFEPGKQLTGTPGAVLGAGEVSGIGVKPAKVQTMVERTASKMKAPVKLPGAHLFGAPQMGKAELEKAFRPGSPLPEMGSAPAAMPKRPGKVVLPGQKVDVKLNPSAGPGKLPTVAKAVPGAPKAPGAAAGGALPKLPGPKVKSPSATAKPPAMGAGSAQAGVMGKTELKKQGLVPSGGNTPTGLGNTGIQTLRTGPLSSGTPMSAVTPGGGPSPQAPVAPLGGAPAAAPKGSLLGGVGRM